jgi:hypothetical protein
VLRLSSAPEVRVVRLVTMSASAENLRTSKNVCTVITLRTPSVVVINLTLKEFIISSFALRASHLSEAKSSRHFQVIQCPVNDDTLISR